MDNVIDLNEYKKRKNAQKKTKKKDKPIKTVSEDTHLSPSQFTRMNKWEEDD